MKVLSVNAGSSTLKFRLYEMPEEKLLMKGNFERIGSDCGEYSIRLGENKISKEVVLKDHSVAVQLLIQELLDSKLITQLEEIKAIGHRVVHGGNKYSKSVVITDRVVKEIEEISDLAPLHNPAHLMGIHAFEKAIPSAKMVACFDTAFHQTMKEKTYLYPVPYEWYVKYHVRKYGFHGLSHEFVMHKMQELLGQEEPNLIICHIGNGASITAIKDGVCIDTSMGFTPNAGIMMGTRSGDIDYSIIPYMMKKADLSIAEMDQKLNKESGLEGIAGMCDLRDIDRAFDAKEQKVVLAVDMYTDRIVDYIAKYYVKLGYVDAICFTAGGGENDPIIRAEVLRKLYPLGVVLDEEKNEAMIVRKGNEGRITKKESKIPAYVIATDEELMIARNTYALVSVSAS